MIKFYDKEEVNNELVKMSHMVFEYIREEVLPNNKQLTDHQQAFSLTEFPANLMLAGQTLFCQRKP